MEYIQANIPCLEEKKEIITAELEQIGYEGFWEEGQKINAFIEREKLDEKLLYDTLAKYGMENSYSLSDLEDRNWNQEWESNFNPVQIDQHVLIRASFHEPLEGIAHEIVINPEMSFGTGHHETTELMVRMMLQMDFKDKVVLDMGSGTGVLAILASQLSAEKVVAIENHKGSVANCIDNVAINQISNVEVIEGSIDACPQQSFDIILSNITKNINQSLLPACVNMLAESGYLLISGFLDFDKQEMRQYCEALGLEFVQDMEINKWQGMLFVK